MKDFFKEHKAGIITTLVMFVSLVLALVGEPGSAIQGPGGWMIVRTIALAWSVILAVGTFTKWTWPKEFKNLNMLKWIALWILFWQVMASFYVADWCA